MQTILRRFHSTLRAPLCTALLVACGSASPNHDHPPRASAGASALHPDAGRPRGVPFPQADADSGTLTTPDATSPARDADTPDDAGDAAPERLCGDETGTVYEADLASLRDCTVLKGRLYISDTQLVDLEMLSNLTTITDDLALFRNDRLVSLHGLHNLREVGGTVSVSHHAVLRTLTGLEQLQSIGGELGIDSNVSLESLTGLTGLRDVGSLLQVRGNPKLTTLQALSGLESVGGDLQIQYNDLLPQAEAEAFAAQPGRIKGSVVVSDNAD